MTHLGDFAVTTKQFFHIHPSPSSTQRKVLKALHFYSPAKGFSTEFSGSNGYSLSSEGTIMFSMKWHLCSQISVDIYAEFFLNGGWTFSGTHSLSSIRSTEWKFTITSHRKPRFLLPIVKPVVLGVVTDDWDADQENFHYFIRSER